MTMPNSLRNIDVSDIVQITIDPAETMADYFGRLFDTLFNRPQEHVFRELLITKTDARKIYKRAYPKAKV